MQGGLDHRIGPSCLLMPETSSLCLSDCKQKHQMNFSAELFRDEVGLNSMKRFNSLFIIQHI